MNIQSYGPYTAIMNVIQTAFDNKDRYRLDVTRKFLGAMIESGNVLLPNVAAFVMEYVDGAICYLDEHEDNEKTLAVDNGYYTVVYPDETWTTIRVSDWNNRSGCKVLSYLFSSDNTSDYAGFASIDENGKLAVWKRFQSNSRLATAARVVTGSGDRSSLQEEYALKSGRCARCNRRLTVPASINRGLGPECASKVG